MIFRFAYNNEFYDVENYESLSLMLNQDFASMLEYTFTDWIVKHAIHVGDGVYSTADTFKANDEKYYKILLGAWIKSTINQIWDDLEAGENSSLNGHEITLYIKAVE